MFIYKKKLELEKYEKKIIISFLKKIMFFVNLRNEEYFIFCEKFKNYRTKSIFNILIFHRKFSKKQLIFPYLNAPS